MVDAYLPSTRAGAKLMHELGREMVRRGHEVAVAAPDPRAARVAEIRREGGLTVLRARSVDIKQASRPVRALAEWRLSRRMWHAGRDYFRNHQLDLVVFYSPTIFFTGLVRRLKAEWGCPAYMILRDIFPQWAVDAGAMKQGGPIYRFFRHHELAQYEVADVIGVQSPANLEYFQDREPGRARLEVLYNWVESPAQQAPTTFRQELRLTDKVVFIYGGNIGVAQDMDNLLRLASSLSSMPDVHFLFVGQGSEVLRITREVERQKISNVTLLGPLSQDDYTGLIAECDVGLISLDARLSTQNFPGKLLSYLAASIPVLASLNAGNDLREVLEANGVGLCCLNGDDTALRDAAAKLAVDAELRCEMGARCRPVIAEIFSVSRAAAQILAAASVGEARPSGADGAV